MQPSDGVGCKNASIVSSRAPASSMIHFHSCLMLPLGSSLSPFNWADEYPNLPAIANHTRRLKRPIFIEHHGLATLKMLPVGSLPNPYRVNVLCKRRRSASAPVTSPELIDIIATA